MILSWSSSNMSFFIFLLLLFVSLDSSLSVSATERCRPNEKKVLLKIKKALNASVLNRSWLPNTDCCDWKSVFCSQGPEYHVNSLYFLDSELPAGSIIPDAIGDLAYLIELTFTNLTGLTGPIPFSITKLQNLNNLEISLCNLTGTIPGFLSKLNNLTYLNLSSNKLKGPIPSFLSEMPRLGYINISGNRFAGTIPESLVKLKDNIDFTLIFSHNKLSGEIPPSFRAVDFWSIDFSHNKLRGDISMLFGRNKTSKYMKFAGNKFEFNMKDLELQLSPTINEFDISHNNIYGSLPNDIGTIELESLNVSYNRLCGPIPQVGNLQTDFDYTCFFHNRCLCGPPLAVACK